jgi:hypothetical protein
MGTVIPFTPRRHVTFDVYEQRHGFKAEAHMNDEMLWNYETDSLDNLRILIQRTLTNHLKGDVND